MKKAVLATCWLALACVAFPTELYMARFVASVEDDLLRLTDQENEFETLIYNTVVSIDEKKLLNIGLLQENNTGRQPRVRSVLDAEAVCEIGKIDYLIYGHYKKSHEFIEAELRIYDRSIRGHRKIFYTKAEPEEYGFVVSDIAQRLVRYLYDISGFDPATNEPKPSTSVSGLNLGAHVGYWTPTGEMFDVMTGIAQCGFGFFVQPDVPLFFSKNFLIYYRFGLLADYSFGLSRLQVEQAFVHGVRLGMPVQLCGLIQSRHCVYIGASVYYAHAFAYQLRVYSEPVWEDSGTFGCAGYGGYEYWCGEGKAYALGTECRVYVDLNRSLSTEISLDFTFKYRMPL